MSKLGVVVVTFNSSDVILDCLDSLLAGQGEAQMRVAVVDNASTDDTVGALRSWASGETPYVPATDGPFAQTAQEKPVALAERQEAALTPPDEPVTLIHAEANGGFAGGVNIGLRFLEADPEITDFWVLNPDSVVPPDVPRAFLDCAARNPGYGMMGGRLVYYDDPKRIQIDGGTINWSTGITGNINQRDTISDARDPLGSEMDFITGASMVVSRAFLEKVGPMKEDYFLYYEEVDWALMRGELPLVFCRDGLVYHKAGTSIGSAGIGRRTAPFSHYFKHRARMMFMRRHAKGGLAKAHLYSLAKAAQLVLQLDFAGANALLRGAYNLAPPANVRARLSPEAQKRAFGGMA